MKHYEILSILAGTISEEEVPARLKVIEEIMEKGGGSHATLEHMGKNRLAYPMKHIRYGYFLLGRFQAKPEAADAIRAKIALLEGVLRVVVRTYNPKTPPHATIAFAGMSIAASREREDGEENSTVFPSAPAPRAVAAKKEAEAPKKGETKADEVDMAQITKKLDQILEEDITAV